MRQFHMICATLLVLGGLACSDVLDVPNTNDPDVTRVLAEPEDVETLIGDAFATIHQGTVGDGEFGGGSDQDGLIPQLYVMGLENYSGNANFGMAARGGIPRSFINNSRGNPETAPNARDFFFLSRAARSASNGLAAMDVEGFTLGDAGRDNRARAFAKFVQGAAMGYLALTYDSATVFSADDAPGVAPPLSSYSDMMDAALAALDEAIALTEADPSGFPLDEEWIRGNPMTADQFTRFVKSFRARFRAGVARTPAERAAVDWNLVIADANAGIQADVQIDASVASGWDVAWPDQHYFSTSWHQMWQFVVGMADTSGAYQTWLATPNAQKLPFVVATPDKRFPRGTTRPDQNTNSPNILPAGQYYRNRAAGQDSPGHPLATSMYDHYRFRAWQQGGRTGPYPIMAKAEMDLLAAEGYIRNNQFDLAAAKINTYRTRNNLPALPAGMTATSPVPGGAACVPKVPVGPNFTTAACGTILEAMKWEYRMETAYVGYGQWFFAGRGWGDLPVGTPIHWPVPFQEMDARNLPFYNLGGLDPSGNPLPGAVAGPTTYGL